MKRLQKLITVSRYLLNFSVPGYQDIKPIRVVDGDTGVDPKPNVTGGVTGAR